MDNLLDDLGQDDVTRIAAGSKMTKETKKKSMSSKNLSLGSAGSDTSSGLTTTEEVRITTV